MLERISSIKGSIHQINIQESNFASSSCKEGSLLKNFASSHGSTERSKPIYYEYSDISLNRERIFYSDEVAFKSPPDAAVENSYGADVLTALLSASATENSQICRAKLAYVRSPELIKAAVRLSPNGDQWPVVPNDQTKRNVESRLDLQTSDNEYGFPSLEEHEISVTLQTNDHKLKNRSTNGTSTEKSYENEVKYALKQNGTVELSESHLAEEIRLKSTKINKAPSWEYDLENQPHHFSNYDSSGTESHYEDNIVMKSNGKSIKTNCQIENGPLHQYLCASPEFVSEAESTGIQVNVSFYEENLSLRKDCELPAPHCSSPVFVFVSGARESTISVDCVERDDIKFAKVYAENSSVHNILNVNIESGDCVADLTEKVKNNSKSTIDQLPDNMSTETNFLNTSQAVEKVSNTQKSCSDNNQQNLKNTNLRIIPKPSRNVVQKTGSRLSQTLSNHSTRSLPPNSRTRNVKAPSTSMGSRREQEIANKELNDSKLQNWLNQKAIEEFQKKCQQKYVEENNREIKLSSAKEEERRRRESFQTWLKQKEAQKRWEKLLKERENEEKKNIRETRSREASEQAFKEWLRKKNVAAKKSAKVGRDNLKLHEQRQRSAAIIRAIQKINLNNLFSES